MLPAETTRTEFAEVIPNPQEVRLELQLILKSEQFARADKQSALLAFLCEKSLAGKSAELKESVLAVEVFHRVPGYSTTEDSLVRVQVHELRRRLREYYAGGGRDRPLRIEIPRGSYGPKFSRIEIPAAA